MNPRVNRTDCADCESRGKSVFCDLHKEELDYLNEEKGCAVYKKGQIVFNAGAYPHGLFCVKEGKIKIFRIGDEGKEQIVSAKEYLVDSYKKTTQQDRIALYKKPHHLYQEQLDSENSMDNRSI